MSTVVEDAPRPTMDPRLRQRRIDVRRSEGRRRLRRLLIALGVVATLVLAWGFTYSTFLDVDHVVVRGERHTTETDVRAAAAIGQGQPMVYIDTGAASRRVEALPWVARAEVRRDYPGTVRIDVVERVPVVAIAIPTGGWRLFDAEGHALGDASGLPPGIVAMTGPRPPVAVGTVVSAAELAAIDVAVSMPPSLEQRVGAIALTKDGSVDLELAPEGTIHLGSPVDLPAKFLAAVAVLDQLGAQKTIGVLDVRAPEAPVLIPG
ncbi:MAG TPA: FtsQ-type POTRA domain-containing protein [Acidimicrobiales bacterium]|nr:FtsQ-type POTRA domain-containing protein [Acidimicrobiales bacterium]